jgi:hypothetical protein
MIILSHMLNELTRFICWFIPPQKAEGIKVSTNNNIFQHIIIIYIAEEIHCICNLAIRVIKAYYGSFCIIQPNIDANCINIIYKICKVDASEFYIIINY